MISRISDKVIWDKFKRASPKNAKNAIKFTIDGDQLLVYTQDSIIVFNHALDRTIGVSPWYKHIPEFEDEYAYRKYVADTLRRMLICRGISQVSMSRRLGISRVVINRYFNYVYPIPGYLVYKMCQEAEILFSDLMYN